jgi:putative phosphoesterase
MKIAIIADIHSNLEAFQAVLKDIKKKRIRKILCLGDIVGYGANPNECVSLVKKLKIPCVQGNHDYTALNLRGIKSFNPIAQKAIRWTHGKLTRQSIAFLKKLPKAMPKEGIFMVHGSPRDPLNEYVYEDMPMWDAKEFFARTKEDIIALGHTHASFVRRFGTKLIFNPGGVGQPRDGNPKASYCIFDTKTANVSIVKVDYPIKKAADKILKAKLPHFLAERLSLGR